jgi:hypothetical protein
MLCSICNISCSDKYSYQKHCESARHIANSINPTHGFKCEYCGKSYQYMKSMKFHQKKCKKYLQSLSMQETDNDQLVERIVEMEKDAQIKDLQIENLKNKLEIAQLKATNVTNNNINKSKNTTNNITNNNNITINAFGDENIDYITIKELIKLCNDKHFCIPNLIENTHFHPDHPENHNVRLPNKKLKYCQILRDNKWETIPKDDAYSDMKSNAFQELSDTNDKHQDKIYGFEEFREKFHNDKKTNKIIDERIDMLFSNKT